MEIYSSTNYLYDFFKEKRACRVINEQEEIEELMKNLHSAYDLTDPEDTQKTIIELNNYSETEYPAVDITLYAASGGGLHLDNMDPEHFHHNSHLPRESGNITQITITPETQRYKLKINSTISKRSVKTKYHIEFKNLLSCYIQNYISFKKEHFLPLASIILTKIHVIPRATESLCNILIWNHKLQNKQERDFIKELLKKAVTMKII